MICNGITNTPGVNRMRLLTSKQMKSVESAADRYGVSYLQMMENAGTMAFQTISSELNGRTFLKNKKFLIISGNGNNGGDGFVVARHLANTGAHPVILLALGESITEDACAMKKICDEMGIPSIIYSEDPDKAFELISIAFSLFIILL